MNVEQNHYYTAQIIASRKLTAEEISIVRSTIDGALMEFMSGVGVGEVKEEVQA